MLEITEVSVLGSVLGLAVVGFSLRFGWALFDAFIDALRQLIEWFTARKFRAGKKP